MDKDILVVPRKGLGLVGVNPCTVGQVINYLNEHGMAMDRATAEVDQGFKQIIPHVIVTTSNVDGELVILATERLSGGNEKRLHGKIALGFGGHVKWRDDITPGGMTMNTVIDELAEELNLVVEEFPSFYGEFEYDLDELPDPTNPDKDLTVNRVHHGLLFNYHIRDQKVVDELDTLEHDKLRPFWIPVKYLPLIINRLEPWGTLLAITLQHGLR